MIRLAFGNSPQAVRATCGSCFYNTWRGVEARRLPMGRNGMSEEINQQRRGFFGTAALAVAAIQEVQRLLKADSGGPGVLVIREHRQLKVS
jgi:hypothetical protein